MRDKLEAGKCAKLLKALADPERLKIVQCLQERACSVTEISELLHNDLANVSHHLGVLRNAGLVEDRKQGKHVFYSLHPDVFDPKHEPKTLGVLDLGCCRLELGPAKPATLGKRE